MRGADTSLVTPTGVTDQIAAILEGEILRGQYRRGEHLQQDEICRRFGVSRTPAREALRKLQALGLLELIPNRGARILRPTLEELRQTYDIRAELEGFAAALAAEHRTDEMVAELTEVQDELREAVGRVERASPSAHAATGERLKKANDAFHWMIHTASANERLRGLIRDLERYFPKDIVRQAITSDEDLHRFYVAEHDLVLEEIIHGRAEGARDAMRDHIRAAQQLLLNYLADIGYDSEADPD